MLLALTVARLFSTDRGVIGTGFNISVDPHRVAHRQPKGEAGSAVRARLVPQTVTLGGDGASVNRRQQS
jgi:hypothetical protein